MASDEQRSLVDLRSDTVTHPTREMRRAMAEAEVGDDAYGEDPTVRGLEEAFAERVGKPASLYVPSGVMANQLALRVLAAPSSTVFAGANQHIVLYENSAAARNAGIQFLTVADADGVIAATDLRFALEAAEHHQPAPALVCVENTHMASGGTPWPIEALGALASEAGSVPVHMDGARLFNAEVATGWPAASFASYATTVMCCMSKGLCAPVGSLLAGPEEVIGEARLERARMGGRMRQAGIIAAGGAVALTTMVSRLAEDHARARQLADAVAERWPGSGLRPEAVRTNIVVFEHQEPARLLAHLEAHGVLAGTIAPRRVRMVTHRDVDDSGIARAVAALRSAP